MNTTDKLEICADLGVTLSNAISVFAQACLEAARSMGEFSSSIADSMKPALDDGWVPQDVGMTRVDGGFIPWTRAVRLVDRAPTNRKRKREACKARRRARLAEVNS